MAELSLTVIPAKVMSDGSHKIRIAVYHKHEARYIITRHVIDDLKQFKDGRVVNRPDAAILNKKLNAKLCDFYDALDKINPAALTCAQLKNYLERINEVPKINTVSECWQLYIDNLRANGQEGTATLNERTRDYFEIKFGKNLALIAVTGNTVSAFDKYFFKTRKICCTTVGMHMRMFRAIVNFAQDNGFVEYKIHPFKNYDMPVSNERHIEITVEEVKRIRDSKPVSRSHIVARDLFMLSYYLGGINLIDLLAYNFRGKRELSYVRTKTENTKKGNKQVVLTIPEEAKSIIKKWMGRDGRLDFQYSFTYHNFCNYVTKSIQSLADSLGIKKRVVYYSARKSFVQHGFELGLPLEALEFSIGHSVKKNRPIFNYIHFMQEHTDRAVRVIIDNLNLHKTKETA